MRKSVPVQPHARVAEVRLPELANAAIAVAAAIAVLLCLLSLAEQFAGVALGMDFPFASRWAGHPTSAMSPAASLSLLLLAVAAPLRNDPRVLRVPVNSLVAAVAASVALFSLLG